MILIFFVLTAEFQPGVPWKGIQSSGDSKSDPYMAPGSVLVSPGTSSLNDSDHQLLRDNIGMRVCHYFFINITILKMSTKYAETFSSARYVKEPKRVQKKYNNLKF